MVGKTADEAARLWKKFQQLEDAGAFAVECELIPTEVMAAITTRTGLATISLGSGPSADVLFVFSSDICGESKRTPHHARVYGNLASLYAQVEAERIRPLSTFRADVASGSYPNDSEMGHMDPVQLKHFITSFDR